MGLGDLFGGGLFGGGGGGGGSGGTFGTGGSESTTQSLDQKAAASEGSLTVGASGKFVEGPDFSGASNVTLTTTDSGAVARALQTVGDVNTGLTNFVNDANAAAVQRQSSLDDVLRQVLDKLSEQSTAEKSGFASLLISPLFWLGIAGLIVLGIFLWRRP
jgi:hypothetical protein